VSANGCQDFCTASKCRELEARIGQLEVLVNAAFRLVEQLSNKVEGLESDVSLLEAAFEAHTLQAIPSAHDYSPTVKVGLAVDSAANSLKVFVAVDENNDSQTTNLPSNQVKVGLAVDSTANTLKVFVAVGDRNDEATVSLPNNEVVVGLAVDNNTRALTVFVAVGAKDDQDTIYLPDDQEPFNLKDLIDLIKNLIDDEIKDWLKDLAQKLIVELIDEFFDNDNKRGKLSIYGDYVGRTLKLTVSDGYSSDSTSIYIPRGGGGGGGEEEEPEPKYIKGSAFLTLEGILIISIDSSIGSTTFEVDIMSALREIKRLVEDIYQYTVIDINGTTLTEFKCEEDNQQNPPQGEPYKSLAYSGKGVSGINALLQTVNFNLQDIFNEICTTQPVLASPDWWQVRLGGAVPQLVCTFRRGETRTYHSLSIPHPSNVTLTNQPQIPQYEKGNWQGMIVLVDNSKFIVNCSSSAEAERICSIAASLIDGAFLPLPYRVWLTERKGTPVSQDVMQPTSLMYYATGQRNNKPDWYSAIKNNDP
jgi:hypothetical protein